jgi:uncharacterized membrane protein YecN with MAPEG domain
MHVTGLYVALAAILVILLSARVVLRRGSARIGIGDGDDRELRKRIRAQGNAIEYLPLALLLLGSLEWDQTDPSILHACGITLIVARVAHAIGLSRTGGTSPERFLGTATTWTVMLVMAGLLIWERAVR